MHLRFGRDAAPEDRERSQDRKQGTFESSSWNICDCGTHKEGGGSKGDLKPVK